MRPLFLNVLMIGKNLMKTDKKQKPKVTREKPVSLHPLGFKQAVTALLKVKPKPKEESAEKDKTNQ